MIEINSNTTPPKRTYSQNNRSRSRFNTQISLCRISRVDPCFKNLLNTFLAPVKDVAVKKTTTILMVMAGPPLARRPEAIYVIGAAGGHLKEDLLFITVLGPRLSGPSMSSHCPSVYWHPIIQTSQSSFRLSSSFGLRS